MIGKRNRSPPRSTVIVRIPLSTDGTGDHPVISGKHEVAIVVGARRNGSSRWSGQAVASTALAVGVPGMEAVQGVLQVPSFLLLPGFLFVAAYLLTAKLVRGRAPPETEKEGFLSLGWSAGRLAGLRSRSRLLLIGLYPLLMNVWLGSPRNILYGFDLGDVIRVWVISLLLGGLGGARGRGDPLCGRRLDRQVRVQRGPRAARFPRSAGASRNPGYPSFCRSGRWSGQQAVLPSVRRRR